MVPLMVPQVPDDITPGDRKSRTSGRLAYSRGGTRTRDPGIMSSSPPPAHEGSPSEDEA